ncbi:MAG: uncharacterized protein A8A55_3611, partial [Amphiamblys sp. WSBS2006]
PETLGVFHAVSSGRHVLEKTRCLHSKSGKGRNPLWTKQRQERAVGQVPREGGRYTEKSIPPTANDVRSELLLSQTVSKYSVLRGGLGSSECFAAVLTHVSPLRFNPPRGGTFKTAVFEIDR